MNRRQFLHTMGIGGMAALALPHWLKRPRKIGPFDVGADGMLSLHGQTHFTEYIQAGKPLPVLREIIQPAVNSDLRGDL